MSPGDTTIIKPGTYSERIRVQISGSSGKPITFKADLDNPSVCKGFYILANYINIEGMEIDNVTFGRNAGIYGKGSNITISGNRIKNVPFSGISLEGSNNKIQDNYLFLCQYGIVINGTGFTVDGNEVERLKKWDSTEDNDYMRFFGSDHVIRNNYFHSASRDEVLGSHVDGFQTFDNNKLFVRNVIIENNTIYNMDEGAMLQAEKYRSSYNIIFRNNVFAHSSAWGLCIGSIPNVEVYNNTFVNIKYHGVGSNMNCIIKNNIFYNAGTGYWGKAEVIADHNLLYKDVGKYDPLKFPKDIVNKDPEFADPLNNNFRLKTTSPARSTAPAISGISTDMVGVTRSETELWAVGALEAMPLDSPVLRIKK